MAIISAFTMIRGLALFHITLAYFFLVAPRKVADQNVIFLLGESMQFPTPAAFNKPNEITAFLAVILAFFGLADLTAVSLPDEIAETYWGTQVPVRLLFLFAITGYTYLFKEGGILAGKGSAYRYNAGDNLKNSIVFTWGFVELSFWFWVFVALRDERRQKAQRLMEKMRAEAEAQDGTLHL